MKHTHHLLPKYKGGSNDKSNLVTVSVTQHAMFHFCNWQLWGDKRDWLAWRGLIGEIGKEEIVHQLRLEGLRKGRAKSIVIGSTPARAANARKHQPKAVEAARSETSKQKRQATFKAISHQQGERNSQFGTCWITDGITSIKVDRNAPIPDGWRRGRVMKSSAKT